MSAIITHLKNKQLLWQASRQEYKASHKCPTGISPLDEALQGGFPQQGVMRIASHMGIGELTLCLSVIKSRQQDQRQLFIIAPETQINAEMLLAHHISLTHTFFVDTTQANDQLWACEQCLKSGTCHTVLLWHNDISLTQAKRLQVAAEQGDCLLILFQYDVAVQPLPINLSMQLRRQQHELIVDITKQRGSWPVSNLKLDCTLTSIRQRYHHQPASPIHNVVALHAQR